MGDPGVPQAGRDSRMWPVLLAAVVTAAAVLAFLGFVGPSGDSDPSASDTTSRPPAATASSVTSPPATPSPTASPTPTRSATPVPTRAATTKAVPSSRATAKAEPKLRRLPVVVFNQTTRRYLAARVGERIEDGGWSVVGVDNWVGTVPRTTVYYPDGYGRDATMLAEYLGVERTRSAVSPMRDDRLTVILTSDYQE